MTTTTTNRRTAKMSTKAAYVAVHVEYIDASTNILTCTARKDMRIDGANGAFVEIKAGEQFSLVRSASLGENMFYIVRNVAGMKKCSCPAMKPCKHEIAVAAKQATKSTAVVAVQRPATMTRPAERGRVTTQLTERMLAAPLNGNRGFSLMRR